MKNSRGLTLVSLIIMIVVLLVLASIGIYYTKDTINSAKLTHFITQLEIVEAQVNLLKQNNKYEDTYDNYDITDVQTISEIDTILEKQLKEIYNINTEEIDEYKSRFKYYEKNELNIEGIEINLIIDIQDGIVISKNYLLYKGVKFYSLKQLENYGLATSSYIVSNESKNYQNPYIPDNYYYVGGTWDTGFVISDEIADKANTTTYNQTITGSTMSRCKGNLYVWIPVVEQDLNTTYTWGVDWSEVTSETDYEAIKNALNKYAGASTYVNQEEFGYYDKSGNLEYYNYGNITEEEYNTLYNDMIKSIYKNGGFYIAAYEMGIKQANTTTIDSLLRTNMTEYNLSEDNTTNTQSSIKNMNTPISKADAVPYTCITQPQAQMLANKVSNSSNLTSSLLFSNQWQMVCIFIQHFSESEISGNYLSSSFTLDRGYYYDINWNEGQGEKKESDVAWLCTTGSSDSNSILNIYDLAGNVSEYVLENKYYGGNFTITSEVDSSIGFEINTYEEFIGARVALWNKD